MTFPPQHISAIYASAMGPGHWPELMRTLGAEFGADSSFMFTSHSETEPDAILLGQNTSAEMVAQFRDYWRHEDIWAAAARRRGWMKRDVVLIGSELVPSDQLRRSRYYNEFARHYGMEGMLGSVLFDGSEGQGIPFTNLCWYRPPGHGDFELRHKRQLAQLLIHFQQALKIQHQLKSLHTRWQLGGPAGRTLSILLNADGRILHANALAEQALASGSGLLHCVNQRLRSLGRRSSPAVDDALAACRVSQRPLQMLVQIAQRDMLLSAVLLPLPVEQACYAGWQDDRHFLLMLELPRDNSEEMIARVAEMFGLSGAEQRLATALADGQTLEQIAEVRCVSHNTVRTQVRSLLAKTGYSRQIDLVRMMSRLLG
ncbi:helix-turn-helix transcriptional regulator [Duganella guangzhouensis]|nr:LuxR C-terminal-related transcriptional regulator [Duganella guangzhouensis]